MRHPSTHPVPLLPAPRNNTRRADLADTCGLAHAPRAKREKRSRKEVTRRSKATHKTYHRTNVFTAQAPARQAGSATVAAVSVRGSQDEKRYAEQQRVTSPAASSSCRARCTQKVRRMRQRRKG